MKINELRANGSQISNKQEFLSLDEQVQSWVKQHSTKHFQGYLVLENKIYALVALGRISTKGHRILLDDIVQENTSKSSCYLITGKIIKPKPLSKLQQVTTYPLLLIWFECGENATANIVFK